MSNPRGQHEDFGRGGAPAEPGSTRSFALVMAGAFLAVGAWVTWRYNGGWGLFGIFAVIAVAFLLVEWLAAALLQPLNRAWHRLGHLLGRIVSPLVLGLVFIGVVTPIGLLRRLAGSRSFAERFDPEQPSYWETRDPPGPDPETMPRQY